MSGKHYADKTVVDGLSFHVRRGESVSDLLGPNGAGKTTTLKMLLGLGRTGRRRPSIWLSWRPDPLPRAATRGSRVGVVPQFDNLDPDFTVRENLLVSSAAISA